MLRYYVIFAALIAAFLAGCTVDTRTVPAVVTVEQAQAEAVWDFLMVRRAVMFEELNAPDTTAARREEIRRIVSAENDLFNIVMNTYAQSGELFSFRFLEEVDRSGGGNVDGVVGLSGVDR